MRAAAAPSAPAWQPRWEKAVDRAGRAAAPHAQRRRPRRDEAARDHAAGHAVRARPEFGHQPQPAGEHAPATTSQLAVEAFAHLLEQLAQESRTRMTDYDKTRRLGRRPLRRGSALPAGTGPGAHRHAARRQRAARRAHRRTAAGLRLEAEKHPVPQAEVQAQGLQSITNLIVRRRYGQGPTIALNAHGDVVPPGEGWTHDPYGGEIEDGKHLRPRRRRQQERLRQLHLRRARAGVAQGAPEGRRRTALHLRRGVRRRARAGLVAQPQTHQAGPADRRGLQLRGGDRAQRLPADWK